MFVIKIVTLTLHQNPNPSLKSLFMALIRERRQLNLSLPLPESSLRRPRFTLPIPPPATVPTTSSAAAISAADFERLEVLGHGSGGTVYKVRHKRTGSTYALKIVKSNDSYDPTARRQLYREIEILRRADSPYVVNCHAIIEKPNADVWILMEFMDEGTLETHLNLHGTFSEKKLSHVARHVLNGLNYLHGNKIIHRDIKPANLLVNAAKEVKIADFGVSKLMCRSLENCNSYVGTCAYMSPERFDPDAYGGTYDGYASDVWSLGLTLMELYMGHFPFLPPGQRPDWATLMCAICFGDPPELPEGASEEFRGFMECCLQKEAAKRWTAAQLLTHPFVLRSLEEEEGF